MSKSFGYRILHTLYCGFVKKFWRDKEKDSCWLRSRNETFFLYKKQEAIIQRSVTAGRIQIWYNKIANSVVVLLTPMHSLYLLNSWATDCNIRVDIIVWYRMCDWITYEGIELVQHMLIRILDLHLLFHELQNRYLLNTWSKRWL